MIRTPSSRRVVHLTTAPLLCTLAVMLAGCFDGGGGGSKGPTTHSGTFVDSPVAGLRYQTDSQQGTTDEQGSFAYRSDESVAFHLGDLKLGEAQGAAILTPLDLVSGAEDHTDDAVTNIAVLLQTLDQDGNASNGISITPAIADQVSLYADRLTLDMDYAAFSASLADLLDDLNRAG